MVVSMYNSKYCKGIRRQCLFRFRTWHQTVAYLMDGIFCMLDFCIELVWIPAWLWTLYDFGKIFNTRNIVSVQRISLMKCSLLWSSVINLYDVINLIVKIIVNNISFVVCNLSKVTSLSKVIPVDGTWQYCQ